MNWIDNLLNKITMYSLMLYILIALVAVSIALAFLGYLPYSPWYMLLNAAILYGACKSLNPLFAWLFKVGINSESSAITALILALIVGPETPVAELWKLVAIAAIAMLSKFIIIYHRRHLFNPAAIAVVIGVLAFGFGASWWVGNLPMLPFILIGGLLFIRKARWFHLSISFLIAYSLTQTGLYLYSGVPVANIPSYLLNIFLYSPILFFSFVMLTEPITMPSGKKPRICYGIVIAVLVVLLPIHFDINYGLELSLLIGNTINLALYGNTRRFLTYLGQQTVAANTTVFKFRPNEQLRFKPGQFLLWTLPHKQTDLRGHRRYFSIASSPTENHISLVTKFTEKSSSFKATLKELPDGMEVMATNVDGEFTLPKDQKQPLVFIAGGIGIAPFRSMIKFLLDTNESRTITLLYSNNTAEEIAFKEMFDQAQEKFGLKVVYTLTNAEHVPHSWSGRTGYVDAEMIRGEVPSYSKALYYVSGPDPMVRAMKKMLNKIEVPSRQIKADYFPGYA